jgi:hypothetical protein
MKKQLFPSATVLMIAVVVAQGVWASGFNWQDHAEPYSFLFGNHIDTHQQTRLKDSGELAGFLYIVFEDRDEDGVIDTTEDGLRIAGHCTRPEDYAACEMGWQLRAKPCIEEVNGCEAMYLYHQHDHPVWLIGPRLREMHNETFLGGSRLPIPQPGFPGHLHWLSEESEHEGSHGSMMLPGSIEELEALFGVDIEVPGECNVSMASALTPGAICPAYFLELRAIDTFAFRHGGELIPVRPGIDLRTHHNFVTSYVAIESEDE